VSPTTLARGRLADHPVWSKALAAPELGGRLIQPVVVSARVEDRERLGDAPWLERISLTELVRDARSASAAGVAGFLLLAASDRKDELALIASERDHIVPRAIRALKDAVPDLAVATDVCVCAYTPHGQCVLFAEGSASVDGTLQRLAEIASVHAEAGADLLVPSGMLEGSVRALREAVAASGRPDLAIAGVVKIESALYASDRAVSEMVNIDERAVPLIPVADREAARARAAKDVAAGADAVIVTPALLGLDIVSAIASSADRPVIALFTADEHGLLARSENGIDAIVAEREMLAAARRAGADLIVSYGARSVL
jgi:porphobilinogen synthase